MVSPYHTIFFFSFAYLHVNVYIWQLKYAITTEISTLVCIGAKVKGRLSGVRKKLSASGSSRQTDWQLCIRMESRPEKKMQIYDRWPDKWGCCIYFIFCSFICFVLLSLFCWQGDWKICEYTTRNEEIII